MNDTARNRRSFLFPKPKRPGAPVGALTQGKIDAQQLHGIGKKEYGNLTCVRRDAMASTFEVMFWEMDRRGSVPLCCKALDVIDNAESQLTVYRETSEVSRLNATAHERPVEVSENLYDLIERSQVLWEETEGAFDITAGPLLKIWGIHTRQDRVPGQEEIETTMQRVGMQHVRLHPDTKAVSFDRPGVELNFGSNGTGYALDCAVGLLREEGMPLAYVQGGQSSHYGMGTPPWDTGWRVAVTSPDDDSLNLAELRLSNLGMATSGIRETTVEIDGSQRHHIVDPRTGTMATGAIGATVVCQSAEKSDALATAFSILGVERTREYCQTHPGVGALLVPGEGGEGAPTRTGAPGDSIVLGLFETDSEILV